MAFALSRSARSATLWTVLVLSLAVNAFFFGATVMDFMRFDRGHDPKNPRIVRMELRWLVDRLPPEAVTSVEKELDPLKPDILARFERLKTLRTALSALVAAPNPDRAAIDANLRAIRLEVGAMQEQIQSRTFDAVLSLPPDQRAPLSNPPTATSKD